jgi:serine/threonine-protein kinase HipA
MAFNILVSNAEGHLRNPVFLLTNKGWRLSPAYDMNPKEMGNGLTLNVSENSNELDISLAMETAHLYQLKIERAESILMEMKKEISNWRVVAKNFGIRNSEIEQTKRVFSLVDITNVKYCRRMIKKFVSKILRLDLLKNRHSDNIKRYN